MIENDPDLIKRLRDPEYPGAVERAILFTLQAWDANCQQHIYPRFSRQQIAPVIEKLQNRVRELEEELARTRIGPDKDPTAPARS